MSRILWTPKEIECLKAAVKARVPHKVIAKALGRSVSSIRKLVLRKRFRSSQHSSASTIVLNHNERLLQDLKKMDRIVKRYLGPQFIPPPQSPKKGEDTILTLLLQKSRHQERSSRRRHREPSHVSVSLSTVTLWAKTEGMDFQKLNRYPDLPEYVIGNRLFSQGKLVMMINQRRIEKGLKPFAIEEFCWD